MKLDEVYLSKSRGAYIRSREKMARRGRTQFRIFLKIEKRNFPLSTIEQLQAASK